MLRGQGPRWSQDKHEVSGWTNEVCFLNQDALQLSWLLCFVFPGRMSFLGPSLSWPLPPPSLSLPPGPSPFPPLPLLTPPPLSPVARHLAVPPLKHSDAHRTPHPQHCSGRDSIQGGCWLHKEPGMVLGELLKFLGWLTFLGFPVTLGDAC